MKHAMVIFKGEDGSFAIHCIPLESRHEFSTQWHVLGVCLGQVPDHNGMDAAEAQRIKGLIEINEFVVGAEQPMCSYCGGLYGLQTVEQHNEGCDSYLAWAMGQHERIIPSMAKTEREEVVAHLCESCGGEINGTIADNTCHGCGLTVCCCCVLVFGHIEDDEHGVGDPSERLESDARQIAEQAAEVERLQIQLKRALYEVLIP